MNLENIQFLKELKQTLLHQEENENDCQASPRYWSIKDYRQVPGNELYDSGDMSYFYNDGDHVEFRNVEDLKEFLNEQYEDVELETKELRKLRELLDDDSTDFETLWDYVENHLNECGFFANCFMKEESFIAENTMFLTKEEAKRHLELNHYHYTSKAHTYAMTSWRAPKVEKLISILVETDWEAIEKIAEEKSFFLKAYTDKIMEG